MPDPTVITLQICFASALGIFVLVSIVRALRARRVAPDLTDSEPPVTDSCANLTVSASMPPPLPVGRVATWPYVGIDLLWVGFIFLTFFALSVGTARMAATQTEIVISVQGLIQSIGFQLVLAGLTLGVMVWRIRPIAWLGLRWKGWIWVFLMAPAGVAAMWLLSAGLYAAGYMQWLDSLGVEPMQDSVKLLQTTRDPLALGLMAVAAMLVAPLCEELVFRGYLYPAAKKFAGPWVAGACSALVFAAAHGSLAPLVPLFFFGCLLVLAYERSGSLWAPIAMHCCFNSTTVTIQVVARLCHFPLSPDL
ncbi:MAG: type II CAAX endopeptidase family protein [Verrucomicrobiota bacterium]